MPVHPFFFLEIYEAATAMSRQLEENTIFFSDRNTIEAYILVGSIHATYIFVMFFCHVRVIYRAFFLLRP